MRVVKRIMSICLILVVSVTPVVSTVLSYSWFDLDERIKSAFALERFGEIFELPLVNKINYSEQVLKSMEEVALANDVNIFKANHNKQVTNIAIIDYYIFLSNADTQFYNFIPVVSGESLTPQQTQGGNNFISTVKTGDPNQVGIIEDFGNQDLVAVYPLSKIPDYDLLTGFWTLECQKIEQCENFRLSLAQEFLKYDYEETFGFTQSSWYWGWQQGATLGLEFSNQTLVILLTISLVTQGFLICFIQISSNKRCSVMKLMGKNVWQIWFTTTGKITLFATFASSLLTYLLTGIILLPSWGYMQRLAWDLSLNVLLITAVSLITIPYLYSIPTDEALKNRADTLWLVILASVAKFGFSLLLLFFGISATNLLFQTYVVDQRYDDWRATFDYGGFRTLNTGEVMFSKKWQKNELIMRYDLYPILNEKGSIYIDSDSFIQANLDFELYEGEYRSIQVNPNYLQTFPVKDNNGEDITIEETETDWILLVPDQYEDQEQEILEYFQFFRTKVEPPITNPYIKTMPDIGRLKNNAKRQLEMFGVDVPERFYTQKIKIIWTQNDQEFFSANPSVMPDKQNLITDPIIQVMTLSNYIANDCRNAFGGADSTLKIKLVDRDPNKTYQSLLPSLEKLGLDEKLLDIRSYNDEVVSEVLGNEYLLKEVLVSLVFIFIFFVLSIIPAAFIFFSYRAKTVAIQKLRGFGIFRRHKVYFLFSFLSWTLLIILCLSGILVNEFTLQYTHINMEYSYVSSPTSLLPILVFVVVDVIISFVTFRLVERARVSNLLKGE